MKYKLKYFCWMITNLKNKLAIFSLSVLFISISLFFIGCAKQSNADPTGTITTTISNNGKIIVDTTTSPNGYIGYSNATGAYYFVVGVGSVTTVGAVADLAAITSKPSTGYAGTSKAVVGSGYVFLFADGYCRLYLVAMSGSTATVKYQYPY
jgi:hypothetical protein